LPSRRSALAAWTTLGEGMAPVQMAGGAIIPPPCCCRARYGFSSRRFAPDRNAASMTRNVAIASSIEFRAALRQEPARENASPCSVY